MKARVMFDTLAYANRLKAVGLESKIAEEQAEANADMIATLFNEAIVTKHDLLVSEGNLRNEIQKLQNEMQVLRSDLSASEGSLRSGLSASEGNLRNEIQVLRGEMKLMESRLETRLTIRLGVMNAACLSIFMGLMSAFHFLH